MATLIYGKGSSGRGINMNDNSRYMWYEISASMMYKY